MCNEACDRMRNRLIKKYLSIVCLLASSLYANQVLAGWSDGSQGSYNKRFGDFPPLDIDDQLQQSMAQDIRSEDNQSRSRSPSPSKSLSHSPVQSKAQSKVESRDRVQNNAGKVPANSYQKELYPEQEKTTQQYKQANDSNIGLNSGLKNGLNNGLGANVIPGTTRLPKKRTGKPKKKHKSGFSMPWSNKGSGFSAPWNNRRSSFSAPWNNNGSGFSAPWDNNDSSFTEPWDNNGSGFSAPWDNNGSGYTWGNRRN